MSVSARFTSAIFLAICFFGSSIQAAVVTTGNIYPPSPEDWSSSTTIYVGKTDDGTLAVNANNFLFSGNSFLGFSDTTKGTATISNSGTIWNIQNLTLGNEGQGELNIMEGGEVSSLASIFGYDVRSTGTLNISGDDSSWKNANDLTIGRFGNGYLNITDGGTATNSQNCTLALDSAGKGTVNVSGNGSTWENTGELCVGDGGKGTLNISDGGLVCISGTLTIDADGNGDSVINIASGGKLALFGNAEESLSAFLDLVQGTDAIRYWDNSLGNWSPLTTGTLGTDYTLKYMTEGQLDHCTLLTVLGQPQNEPGPGDANGDGRVDGSDVTILAGSWQILSGATWEMGDFNGDGKVDGSDVTILAGSWQVGVDATNATTVPEPSMLLILLFALPALGFVRHIK